MDEDAPVLSADGLTLYFCSRGHDSMGGYDIFRSTYDATSGTWSKPLNLGYPFNSPADDIYFIPDSLNTIFHLASNREGTIGQEDLFVIKMHSNVLVKGRVTDKRTGEPLTGFTVKFVAQRKPERQETITTDSNGTYSASLRSNYYYNTEIRSDEGNVLLNEILEVSPAYVENTQLIENFQIDFTAEEIVVQRQRLRLENLNLIKIQYLPEDSLIISGKVNNTEGVVPDARVTIRKENSGDVLYETQTDAKGAYSFSFVSEKETDYIIEIHKSNYLLNSIAVLYNEKVNVIGNQPEQQSARINAIDVTTRLSEIKVGAKQVLGGVYFEFKSADLFSESYIALDKLVNFLEQHPNITLEVGGYTDDSGTQQKNKQLSLKRAQTVSNYLQAKGISGQRLKAAGYGKSGPIVSNEFALNGRDVNRRVEIKILSN
jgi:outer membrane protein OmpA-like peptidoglycan-associated protein